MQADLLPSLSALTQASLEDGMPHLLWDMYMPLPFPRSSPLLTPWQPPVVIITFSALDICHLLLQIYSLLSCSLTSVVSLDSSWDLSR